MENKKQGFNKESFFELVRFALIAIAIVIPIRVFIAQPFVVSGSSMFPTFENKQYLVIDEISYRFKEPQRGDVVVFKYPADKKKFFIKRVIGLPNEEVQINGSDITIVNKEHPEGIKLDQPYVQNHSQDSENYKLKDGEYYVMGDNRNASYDSRAWGPVPKKLLIGKVLFRLLPLNKIGLMPGDYKQI